MSAPTHPRTRPAPTGAVDIRLRWWAIALPAVAFAALLLLILDPVGTPAAAGDPVLAHLLSRAEELVLG